MPSLREKVLAHASLQEYDPNARRERYLRERKLKGRRPGQTEQPSSGWSGGKGAIRPHSTDQAPPGGQSNTDHKAPKPVTPERVAALQVRLDQLKEVLARLVEESNRRAGVEPKSSSSSKTETKKTADTKKPEKKTAAEKKDDAKNAKERRDKEAPTKRDSASDLKTQIAAVTREIAAMREKLAAVRKKKAPPKKPGHQQGWAEADKDKGKSKPIRPPATTEGRHH